MTGRTHEQARGEMLAAHRSGAAEAETTGCIREMFQEATQTKPGDDPGCRMRRPLESRVKPRHGLLAAAWMVAPFTKIETTAGLVNE